MIDTELPLATFPGAGAAGKPEGVRQDPRAHLKDARRSPSRSRHRQGVDGRDKPGHDAEGLGGRGRRPEQRHRPPTSYPLCALTPSCPALCRAFPTATSWPSRRPRPAALNRQPFLPEVDLVRWLRTTTPGPCCRPTGSSGQIVLVGLWLVRSLGPDPREQSRRGGDAVIGRFLKQEPQSATTTSWPPSRESQRKSCAHPQGVWEISAARPANICLHGRALGL